MADERDGHVSDGTPERVLDRLTDGVFGLDTDWRFTYLNETARAIVSDAAGESFTAAELRGRNLWELLPEAVGTTFESKYREAVRTGEQVSFDAHYAPLDAWLEVRAYPSETGLSVCFRDVTERREKIDRLADRETVLREIYEAIADRESSFEDRVDDLLRIGQRVLDTSHGTLSRVQGDEYVFEVVRSPGDLSAGDTVDLSVTNCERVVLTEETLVLANIAEDAPDLAERAGNRELGISCYLGTPVVVDDEVYGTFCFYDTDARTESFSDWEVTLVDLMGRWVSVALERELTEDRLRHQNERLEKFATLVSHDLRNPLNVAEGWLEVASEECDSEAIPHITDSHDRMRAIVDDLLLLARAGRTVDDPVALDVAAVAADAWSQVETANATLTVDVDAEISGDRSRIQQLFENLFRNCVEHGSTSNRTESGDAVEHGSTNDAPTLSITVGSLPGGFYVADDGVGIPESEREHVLEFGYTTAEDGTGIGLGIVEDIATAHGWQITVAESEVGGTRFEFTDVA
jgi:nitrogen-specific signal transduction histidine kinase